jgi:DNA invertase Pin-like site-specific DNA recombinase
MALYGYARVSTLDQNLGIQRAALKVAGCDVIRAEKVSGTRRDGRTELQVLLDFLRPGDALVVTRILPGDKPRRWAKRKPLPSLEGG